MSTPKIGAIEEIFFVRQDVPVPRKSRCNPRKCLNFLLFHKLFHKIESCKPPSVKRNQMNILTTTRTCFILSFQGAEWLL